MTDSSQKQGTYRNSLQAAHGVGLCLFGCPHWSEPLPGSPTSLRESLNSPYSFLYAWGRERSSEFDPFQGHPEAILSCSVSLMGFPAGWKVSSPESNLYLPELCSKTDNFTLEETAA